MFMNKLVVLVSVALASVTVVTAGGDLKLCTGRNLSGTCKTISYLNNECQNLEPALEDRVRSVDPVGDDHKCFLFEDQDCEGDSFDFTKHHNDLGDFNDLASSFYCKNK